MAGWTSAFTMQTNIGLSSVELCGLIISLWRKESRFIYCYCLILKTTVQLLNSMRYQYHCDSQDSFFVEEGD